MSTDGCYYNITKQNKWKHQLIHKKFNKMQYASKHYGTSELIQKRKNPVKQRKDRKKFKVQRNRKKIYKNMVFDYDDFLNQNKSENYKRIQTRPSISYYSQHKYNQLDIDAIYIDYYHHENKQQIETLYNYNDIPIWQCDICTYINIEKLEFCAICNNSFKYDYDNNGLNNNNFYSIKYVSYKNKSKRKSKKNVKIKKFIDNKNSKNTFGIYWDDMIKWKNNYEKFKINKKPKTYKKTQMIIVLSINNKQNGICLNYKPNQSMYARITNKNKLFFDPIIITNIFQNHYPFYEIPMCIEPKVYQSLSKNNNKNYYNYGMSVLQYELLFIVKQIKQQLQSKSVRNKTLEEMINNYKLCLKIVEKSAIDSKKILSSQNIININEQNNIQCSNNIQNPIFNIQLDVLMYKKHFSMSSNDLRKYKNIFHSNSVNGLDEIKQESFLLKEINLKTYNEKTFTDCTSEDIHELNASKQTNIWFDMFQHQESENENDERFIQPLPQNNSYQFIFTNEYDRNVDIYTSLERFRSFSFYENYLYQQFNLKNEKLINIAKKCVNIIFEDNNCQFRFDEKHIPYYNLLPCSFKISRILYKYLPAMDIINNIFIPMIGYNKMYYVTINTQIISPQRNKINDIKSTKMVNCQDNKIEKNENIYNDNDIAVSYSVLYSQLIAMGFDIEISLEAAEKFSNNINSAIDWIRNTQIIKSNKNKNIVMKYNYDMNWEAIALYEEEEEEESSSRLNNCRWCRNLFCTCYDSSYDSSDSD